MSRHILLVTDSYPPEIRSASHLMQELAEELATRKFRVTVLTCMPRYNVSERVDVTNYPECADEAGIKVIRVKTLPHHKVNMFVRGIAQLLIPRAFLRAARKHHVQNVDAVIVYSPPLPLARVGAHFKSKSLSRYILNVQDVFPQNAIDLGALKSRLLILFFERMERNAYRNADLVTVHSEGNRKLLLGAQRLDAVKLVVLHNWIDVAAFESNSSPSGDYRRRFGLEGKFVFLFAGVLGPAQGLDIIIEIAGSLQTNDEICFLLVGDGMEKERLQQRVRDKRLHNIIFQPFVDKQDYARLVADCDVGLVCLNPFNHTPVVPGKILGYMAGGLPVLAFLNKESDGHRIIHESSCGITERSDASIAVLARHVTRLYHRRPRLKKMGENGRKYVAEHFTRQKCVDQLEYYLRREQLNGTELSTEMQLR